MQVSIVELFPFPVLSSSHSPSFISATVKSIKLTGLLCGPEKKGSFHCVICSSGSPCQANFSFFLVFRTSVLVIGKFDKSLPPHPPKENPLDSLVLGNC